MKHISRLVVLIILFTVSHTLVYSQEKHYDLSDHANFVVSSAPRDSLNIKFVENIIIIENLQKDETLEIFNIMGVKVFSRRLKSGTNEYPISLPKGYYIIKIGKTTKKIIITR